MRNLLMYKGSDSKVKKALISVLIGDVFGKKRYAFWLFMFKVMYYMLSLSDMRGTFMAWRKRKRSIRVVEMGVAG